MKNNLLSLFVDEISLSILKELYQIPKPLSVYDFKEAYSLAQYRYALRRLHSCLIVSSFRKNRRLYYVINPLYEDKLSPLIEFRTALTSYPSLIKFIPLLKHIDGWAIAGSTALDHFVPFLSLSGGKHSFYVRSVKEEEKLAQIIPQALLDVQIQPTYFIKHPKIIQITDVPLLSPEILFMQLLKHPNARLSLAALFLLPYITPAVLFSRMTKEKVLFSTITYLLFCLQEYLQDLPSDSPLRIWFYNIDQYDQIFFFQEYLKLLTSSKIVRRKSDPPRSPILSFSVLRKQWKKRMNDYSKWDLYAAIFNEQWIRFTPEAIEALYSQDDFYRLS